MIRICWYVFVESSLEIPPPRAIMNPVALQIRYQPDPSFLQALHEIDVECFPDEPLGQESLSSGLRQDFWVALRDGTPAGFAYLVRRPGTAWLSRLGTASAHRRQGVATALLGTVLKHCVSIGLPETILYVRTDNAPAIKLYERFGFRAVESTYQFILSSPLRRRPSQKQYSISAVAIDAVAREQVPAFPLEWSNLPSMHRPPDTHVLIFREGTRTVGYCRLNPGFPGCFPLVVERPSERLMPVLRALIPYLRPDKDILKLTFWDSETADAYRSAGLRLNYELLKMHRRTGAVP